MSKTLVLAEKPSVGRDIARVLNCTKSANGYLEGGQYIVTWALGHLVTLADPESYGNEYKTWKLEDLPIIPPELKLVVIKQTGKQFNAVKSLMNRGDVKEIVIATDAGREGELVARWILEKARVNKPVKRLWISSVTDKAIKEGFAKLRPGKDYENLYHSAVARSEADWFVGINATRALTTKHNAQLSCGRVQTPTLNIIAKREEDIKNFKPVPFYGLTAEAGNHVNLTWKDAKSGSARTFDKERAEELLKKTKGHKGKITNIDKSMKKKFAPKLYDLTELQKDAHRLFGFSAKETLGIMQKLYEQHKVLTYPRTDSNYLSTDMTDTLKERVKACSSKPYAKFTMKILNAPIKANKSFVDDSKVTDHHAIIPTEQAALPNKLSAKEEKIYDLVVKRFLAVLLPPYEYEQVTLNVQIGSESFAAKGKKVVKHGWRELYTHHDEDASDEMADQMLPDLQKGEDLAIVNVRMTSGETKPPERFNEGTLLGAMENPAKFMGEGSKDLKKTLEETGGLGTVATRADIIEKLFNTFLIEKKGKDIFITSKGSQLLDLVPEDLKSPSLTAEWEQKLSAISQGKLSKKVFINEMKTYAKEIVNEIKGSSQKFKHDNVTGSKCPDCGKLMLEVNGKKGKMLVCQDRECGHRKNVYKTTNVRCPNCHKKMQLRGEGEGQLFVCSCGHREKLSAFNKRKSKQSGKNVSKRDVAQYMKKQNKQDDEPINTALADALAKLKLK
ncbi:DNA topoisomerase III [Falsibacillus pallidus]|uniref:DNA topoisomerase 3 n=1 Tax=Falsibacillus pallidus TaxID=493781 RepID=A0A370GET9_9BACI|nr:DNA topoisomerase III [Falsibacillus pallidus]RDI42322.1 DNA topoisomerase-3 [Falsibacillus pallidus]